MDIVFDTSTLKHSVLIPILTKFFKQQIKEQIEYQVESNLTGFVNKLGDMMNNSISESKRPNFMSGIEAARNSVKSTQFSQVFEKKKRKT